MVRSMVLRSWVSFGLTVVGLSLAQACSSREHVLGEDDGVDAADPVTEGSASAAAAGSGGEATAGGVIPGIGVARTQSGGEPTSACVHETLVGTVSGTTLEAGNDFSPSCAAGASPDVAYRFVAPRSGYYSFDSAGSAVDAVVALFAACDGAELACNSAAGEARSSEVVAHLAKDEEVVVVLDGNWGDAGQFKLNVKPVTCPGLDLTGQPLPAYLSTTGQSDQYQPTCGEMPPAPNSPERTIRWVPEQDGLYRFTVKTSAFRPTLSLFQGATCAGDLVQCSYNVQGGFPPEVTRWLRAGEPVTLIVDSLDGGSGAFTFDVEKLPGQCKLRPQIMQNMTGVLLDETSGSTQLSSGCTWAGNQYQNVDQPYEEHIYPIHIPSSGFTRCIYRVENPTGAWAAYLLEGNDCGGRELDCQVDTEGYFDFSPEDAGDYLLVVENQAPFFGLSMTYDITRTCY